MDLPSLFLLYACYHQTQLAVALTHENTHQNHNKRRRPECLTTPEASAWRVFDKGSDDNEKIEAMGLNGAAFELLHAEFRKHYRHKFHLGKGGRPAKCSTRQALGLLLQYYCSTSDNKAMAMVHGMKIDTLSRVIRKAEVALEVTLKNIPEARVRWPSQATQAAWAELVQHKFPSISGRFGFVDAKNFNVQEPSDIDTQNAIYNGWQHATKIAVVLSFGVDGTLIWAKHICCDSLDDGDMTCEMDDKLCDPEKTRPGYGFIADTAFPMATNAAGTIISPLNGNELEQPTPAVQDMMLQLSSCLTSLRQACAWGGLVGSVERVWRRLALPLPYDQDVRRRRLANILKLFNLRVRCCGITQIGTYFEA